MPKEEQQLQKSDEEDFKSIDYHISSPDFTGNIPNLSSVNKNNKIL